MKQREYSIDLLKFFAALLITNSHLEIFEPVYPLATGGSIGDVLFFFCSGYIIFMGRIGRFDNWYKRRLNRIFAPIICWGIISAFCFNNQHSIDYIIVEGGGWFVQCILLYFLLAYPIRKYALKYLWVIIVMVAVVVCIWFFLLTCTSPIYLYGWNYCKWAAFFLFFLQGAKLGLKQSPLINSSSSFSISLVALIGCVISWYGILYFQQRFQLLDILQLFSLLPLLGISYYFFKLCKSEPIKRLFESRYINPIIRGIGGLCFEIYLVQYTLFANFQSPVEYPYNILIIWPVIFLWAYILYVFTAFFRQTTSDSEYDWKKILKIY